jgi:hypothetical protein
MGRVQAQGMFEFGDGKFVLSTLQVGQATLVMYACLLACEGGAFLLRRADSAGWAEESESSARPSSRSP